MSDKVYVISDKANKALEELASYLKRNLGKIVVSPSGLRFLLTRAEAQRLYFEAVRTVASDGGFHESHDGRMVRVKCSQCGRIETIAAQVTRYRCRCDPHVDRFACKDTLTSPSENELQ